MRNLIIALFMLITPMLLQAQQSTAPKPSGPKPILTNSGFRMSITKMKSNSVINAPQNDGPTRTEENKDISGVSIGYAYVRVNQAGFIFNLAYMTNDNEDLYAISKFEASLASGFSTRFSGKIGINGSMQHFKDKIEGATLTPGVGMNVGLGFEFNKALGIDLTYLSMNQKLDLANSKVFFQHQGLEVALRATF